MQAVSANWATNIAASVRQVNFGLQMCWPLTLVNSNFFTIGTSTIGGPDIIKSGGSTVAFFDQYQFTDYSDRLIVASVSQKIGQYPYGMIMGQAGVTLDNSDYLFTPGFDPTIGNYILPNRPLKFSLGFSGETLQQFIGFTDQPVHDRNELTVTVNAFDALNYAATYVSQTVGVLTNYTTDQIIQTGLLEMGFSASQFVLDASLQQPIGALAPYGQRWGDIFQMLCEAEQGLLFVDENGIIRFWNRQHMTNNQTSVWSLDYTNMENLQSESTPIFNDVIVKANPRVIAAHQQVWSLGMAQVLNPSATTTIEADFTDDYGPMPVTSLDTPVAYTSATYSSFTVNTAADGSGTDMTGSVTVSSVTNRGTTAFISFSNSTGSTLYLTKLVLWGVPAKVIAPVSIHYTDSTSISTYGRNPGNNGDILEIDNDAIQDPSTANSLAYSIVQSFKDSKQRYLAFPHANPAIQIGDYIQVTNSDSGVVKNMWVTGRTVKLAVGELSQILELEERAIVNYFKIGTSTIGGPDLIAP